MREIGLHLFAWRRLETHNRFWLLILVAVQELLELGEATWITKLLNLPQ